MANVLRCSNYQEQELHTSALVNGITTDRCELAEFVGYKNFAEMSMTTKMAGSLQNVYKFLQTLLQIGNYLFKHDTSPDSKFYCVLFFFC